MEKEVLQNYEKFNGKIFEISVLPEQLEQIAKKYKIYGLRELEGKRLGVRIFSDFLPEYESGCTVDATLEDVYLYQMGGTWNACAYMC